MATTTTRMVIDDGAESSSSASTSRSFVHDNAASSSATLQSAARRAGKERMRFDDEAAAAAAVAAESTSPGWKHDTLVAPDNEVEDGFWARSKRRAQADRTSYDYILRSGIAGGVAGCVAKTAIAPLDRVKILFQTSNAEFRQYAGTPMGLLHAIRIIYRSRGILGLFQGHSATLLRIFPYAGIKYMAYDRLEHILMPRKDLRTPGRLFLAGSLSGVASVFVTYPLELIRVRLAFQTKQGERSTFRQIIKTIAGEGFVQPAIESVRHNTASVSGIVLAPTKPVRTVYQAIHPFYRGFSVTLLGMIPYAGVSFLTYGTLKRHLPDHFPVMKKYKTISDLSCGAVAGAVSQTASYPFEVIRRRMQVGGIKAPGLGGHEVGWRDAVRSIWKDGKGRIGRGFYVGLSIGYIKVIPMTSLSFATWQFMKRRLEI